MATQRYISTSFWDDPWVRSITPEGRYIYLYLLTSPLTNIAGVYQISLDRIVFDTGYPIDRVSEAIDTFTDAKKAYYKDGFIILPNWPKHQKWRSKKKIETGIRIILEDLRPEILSYLKNIGYTYPIDSLSIPCAYQPNYSNSNSNSNSDTDRDSKTDSLPAPPQPEEDDIPFAPLPGHTLAIDWYKVYHSKTGKLIQPSEKDYKAASDLLKRTDIKTAQTLIPGYFDCDQWWMKSRGSEKIVYSFQGFCRNFTELLSLQPQPRGRPSVGTCPDCGTVHLGAKTCPRCGKELTYAS